MTHNDCQVSRLCIIKYGPLFYAVEVSQHRSCDVGSRHDANSNVINTLAENALGLETGAIHLHGEILERLWCQEFDNSNRFSLCLLFCFDAMTRI